MKTILIFFLAAVLPLAARAQSEAAGKYFHGLRLVNQEGRTIDLYDDVLKDRVVVINTFFTTCEGSCPIMAGNFARLQKELGDERLQLVSISADPLTDTPAKLKEYAARMHASARWTFLTGQKEQVDAALRKLGQYAETPSAHSNIIIIGNLRTGLWKKAFGLAKPEEIAAIVKSVLDDE